MKILTQLKAQPAPDGTPYVETRGIVQSVHLEPATGFFVRLQLGESGLTMKRPGVEGAEIAIPHAELLALAVKHDERFSPAPAPLSKARAAKLNRSADGSSAPPSTH